MQKVSAEFFSPGGNPTLLVTTPCPPDSYREIAKQLLCQIPTAEQVGFIQERREEGLRPAARLVMAGGEFCGNGGRSFVSFLHHQPVFRSPDGNYTAQISGTDRTLNGFAGPNRTIALEMPVKPDASCISQVDAGKHVVRMDGITHAVIYDANHAGKTARDALQELKQLELTDERAAGIIYYSDGTDDMAMNPFVHVAGVGFYNETSCASGATAVALTEALQRRRSVRLAIGQRSGDRLHVAVDYQEGQYGKAVISGAVRYLGRIDFELPI